MGADTSRRGKSQLVRETKDKEKKVRPFVMVKNCLLCAISSLPARLSSVVPKTGERLPMGSWRALGEVLLFRICAKAAALRALLGSP